MLLGTRDDQKWFQEASNQHLIMKHLGTLGPDPKLGDVQEIRCLNRLIRYVQPPFQPDERGYIEWEADPRHAEILH